MWVTWNGGPAVLDEAADEGDGVQILVVDLQGRAARREEVGHLHVVNLLADPNPSTVDGDLDWISRAHAKPFLYSVDGQLALLVARVLLLDPTKRSAEPEERLGPV